jgi:5'-nucleotidase
MGLERYAASSRRKPLESTAFDVQGSPRPEAADGAARTSEVMMIQLRIAVSVTLLALMFYSPAYAQFRVLVTNDDGIGAEGIDAVVNELKLNPALDVTIVAPATNQSGTGDSRTLSGSLTVDPNAMTASLVPATSVDGFPADTVLVGVHVVMPQLPDMVVSGSNFGANITREVASLSGTVGAALTAARIGIPAIAVSQGLAGSPDYGPGARYVARLVDAIRLKKGFLKKFTSKNLNNRHALNVNVPSCSTGSIRGVELVPLGAQRTVTGYNLTVPGPPDEYEPVVEGSALPIFTSDCESTLEDPTTDLEAFSNGFLTVTPINADFTVDSKVKRFKFATKIAFD